jgi:hypothetical protein
VGRWLRRQPSNTYKTSFDSTPAEIKHNAVNTVIEKSFETKQPQINFGLTHVITCVFRRAQALPQTKNIWIPTKGKSWTQIRARQKNHPRL